MPRSLRDFRKFGLDADDVAKLEYYASIPYSEPDAAVVSARDTRRGKAQSTNLGRNAGSERYEDDPAFAAGLARSRHAVADMLDDLNRKTCYLNAQYSAIGPNQAPNNAAFTGKPPLNDTVAISPSVFGFPYGHA